MGMRWIILGCAIAMTMLLLAAPATAQTPWWLLDAQNDQRFIGSGGATGTVQLFNPIPTPPALPVTIVVERVACWRSPYAGYVGAVGYLILVSAQRPDQYYWVSSRGRSGQGEIQGDETVSDWHFGLIGELTLNHYDEGAINELGVILLPGQGLAVSTSLPGNLFHCRFQGSEK